MSEQVDTVALNNLANAGYNYAMNKEQIKAQKELQEEQNQWNYNMWLENNEYNSPSMQRQLYEQAGLNPAMFISGLDATSGSPATSSVMSVPSFGGYAHTDFSNIAAQHMQQQQLDLNSKQLNLNKDKTEAEIKKLASETTQINIDNELRSELNQSTIDKIQQDVRESAGRIAVQLSDIRLKDAQTKYQNASTNKAQQEALTESMIRKHRIDNMVQDTLLKQSNIKLNDEEAKLVAQTITNYVLSNGQLAANLDLNGLDLKIKKTTSDGLDLEYKLKNTDTWKETFKRMGVSSDQLTQGYVNGILSSISNTAIMLFLSKGLRGGRNGEMRSIDPKSGQIINTGYQGSYGPRP